MASSQGSATAEDVLQYDLTATPTLDEPEDEQHPPLLSTEGPMSVSVEKGQLSAPAPHTEEGPSWAAKVPRLDDDDDPSASRSIPILPDVYSKKAQLLACCPLVEAELLRIKTRTEAHQAAYNCPPKAVQVATVRPDMPIDLSHPRLADLSRPRPIILRRDTVSEVGIAHPGVLTAPDVLRLPSTPVNPQLIKSILAEPVTHEAPAPVKPAEVIVTLSAARRGDLL